MGRLLLAALAAFLLLGDAAYGRWKAEYASQPQSVRDWYANALLTPAAQQRLRWVKCCDHADVVRTRFHVNKRDGKDEWFYLVPGSDNEWRGIPDDIIHWGESAPGGKPTLFIYQEIETCFWPGEGGI